MAMTGEMDPWMVLYLRHNCEWIGFCSKQSVEVPELSNSANFFLNAWEARIGRRNEEDIGISGRTG